MLEFGKLEIVEKTFTREGGAVRTQAYNGIKFRRSESNKGKKAAVEANEDFKPSIQEQFFLSNAAFAKLGILEYALTEAKIGDKVLLMVLEDKDDLNPPAKFCRQSTNKDNTLAKKGKMFSNEFLSKDLESIGVLKADQLGNQYLALTDVTAEVSGAPAHIKAIYNVTVDTSVNAEEDDEDAAESVGEKAASTEF